MTGTKQRFSHRAGATRRRAVAWLGLVIFSFNVLASALLPMPAMANALDDGRGAYVVCTAAGMIEFDQSGIPIDKAHDSTQICVFCLPLCHGGINVPPTFVLAEAHLLASGAILPATDNLESASPRLTGSSAPRAPPQA